MGQRRIITGHDAQGLSRIVADEELDPKPIGDIDPPLASFFQVWATHEMPVDLSDEALARQREGSTALVVGKGAGTVLRVGVLEPGSRSPMHRSQSVDYGILLEGECEMELDGGETVTVRAGDVVVQRGTNHVWHNRSEAPCRFAWVLIDSTPPEPA